VVLKIAALQLGGHSVGGEVYRTDFASDNLLEASYCKHSSRAQDAIEVYAA
jgi:hypothetical protein